MRLALAEAGWRAEEVDQVHLSSCGRSGLADREREAAARTAPSAKKVFVTAQTGDTLGASGAVQLAAALVGTPDGGKGGSRRCLVFTSDPGGDAVCLAVQGVDA